MIEAEVTVENPTGIHARPASAISSTANEFEAEIMLISSEGEINAKSIMGILTLGAEHGSKLIIRAEGEDENEAIKALQELFVNKFQSVLD